MFARINKLPYGQFVGLHLAVMAVLGCWVASGWLFAFLIDGADLLPETVAALVMPMAVLSPLPVVCWCTVLLLRRPPQLWLAITAIFGAAPVVGVIALMAAIEGLLSHYELDGPTSPRGLRPVVEVHDEPLFFQSWFYHDVHVLAPNGDVVAQWGERSCSRFRRDSRALCDSMRWTSPTTLTFVDDHKTVQLEVK